MSHAAINRCCLGYYGSWGSARNGGFVIIRYGGFFGNEETGMPLVSVKDSKCEIVGHSLLLFHGMRDIIDLSKLPLCSLHSAAR